MGFWTKYGLRPVELKMMDGGVRVLCPFNSISIISRRWKGEHERLCAMKRRLGSGRISPPAGYELKMSQKKIINLSCELQLSTKSKAKTIAFASAVKIEEPSGMRIIW